MTAALAPADHAVFRARPRRPWIASAAAHVAAFAALSAPALLDGGRRASRPAASVVEFEAPPPPPRPRVAPPPEPLRAPEPPRAADPAPVARRAAPARRASPRVVAAPRVMTAAPSANAPAGDAVASGDNADFRGGAVGEPREAVVPTPQPAAREPAPLPAPVARGPVQLPEDAVAPVPDPSNAAPEYPAAARAAGLEAVVIARLVVDAGGEVTRVDVLRGHPAFDDAVREALRRWRFTPASVDGHAIAVYRVVRLPFRLTNL